MRGRGPVLKKKNKTIVLWARIRRDSDRFFGAKKNKKENNIYWLKNLKTIRS